MGVSIAVALFPTLSRDAALGRVGEIRRQVMTSVRIIFFVTAPLTAIMVVLREPLTAVFFQYGLFDERSAERTAQALLYFSIGLFAHSVVHVVTRAFYAMHDTRTPVLWAVVAVALNIPLMLWLVGPMGIEGLALALSVAAIVEVLALLWSLRRRIESIMGRELLRSAGRATVAAAAAALLMFGALQVVSGSLPAVLENGLGRLVVLLGLSAAGLAIYAVIAGALRSPELDQLAGIARRRLGRGGG